MPMLDESDHGLACRDPVERICEHLVLLGGADGHADCPRRSEAVRRAYDHSLPEELLEERARVLAHLREDEVRYRRHRRLEAVLAQRMLDARAKRGVLTAPPLDLLRVVH